MEDALVLSSPGNRSGVRASPRKHFIFSVCFYASAYSHRKQGHSLSFIETSFSGYYEKNKMILADVDLALTNKTTLWNT